MSERLFQRSYHEEEIGTRFKSGTMVFDVINGEITYVNDERLAPEFAHSVPNTPKWNCVRRDLDKLYQNEPKVFFELFNTLSKESMAYKLMQEIAKVKIEELKKLL